MGPFEASSYSPSYNNLPYSEDSYRPADSYRAADNYRAADTYRAPDTQRAPNTQREVDTQRAPDTYRRADTYRPSRSKDPRLQPRPRQSSRSRSRSPERSNSRQRLSSGLNFNPRLREVSRSRESIIKKEHRTTPSPPPRPATPPRGMTGTNNVPLAPRRLSSIQKDTPTAANVTMSTTTTNPTISSNASSSEPTLTSAVTPKDKPLSMIKADARKLRRYNKYLSGPPDPPADIIVWIGISFYGPPKLHGKNDLHVSYSLVWEKGSFENVSKSFYGKQKNRTYGEFMAVSHILTMCPSNATLLIKTPYTEAIDAFEQPIKIVKYPDILDELRTTIKHQIRNRAGQIFWKRIPLRAGLPLSDMATSIADKTRKKEQKVMEQRLLAQQTQLATGSIISPLMPTSQPAVISFSPPFQLAQVVSNADSQAQTTGLQRRKMKSPTTESDRLAALLREKALATMRSGDQYSFSPSPATNDNKSTFDSVSGMTISKPMHMDEDGRLTKAVKSSLHTSAPQQQRQREQYLQQLPQYGSESQQLRDPRIQRKELGVDAPSATFLPQPSRSTKFPASSQSYATHGDDKMMYHERNESLANTVQSAIRSSPNTNTEVSRSLSMDNERSNGHATEASSSVSLSRNMGYSRSGINIELPTHKVQTKNEEHANDTDSNSNDEFYDALEHWVGKYREDDDDDDADEKDDGNGTDPSAVLSWISNIL
ncbi:hypothetical protein BDC45DRAFT_518733 [Circinella umbellata]|nr:hypothetical protein BDC45DRAFT_518733 [Circinella umbellata]